MHPLLGILAICFIQFFFEEVFNSFYVVISNFFYFFNSFCIFHTEALHHIPQMPFGGRCTFPNLLICQQKQLFYFYTDSVFHACLLTTTFRQVLNLLTRSTVNRRKGR